MKTLLSTAQIERVLEDDTIARSPCAALVGVLIGERQSYRDALDDAVALLRDWEDYDPDDPGCSWQERRDEFLAEHEEAGR